MRPPRLTPAGAELAAAGLDEIGAIDVLPDAVLTHECARQKMLGKTAHSTARLKQETTRGGW